MDRFLQRAGFAIALGGALITAVAAPGLAASRSTGGSSRSSEPLHPGPDAFVQVIDNPWFPQVPGTTLVYRGTKDGKQATDIVRVTHRTRVISGIRCMEIEDTLLLDGRVEEHTLDWYAQTANADVWYFGEKTAEYDADGNVVSREGSWRDGVNGAQAGIFMFGRPTVGRSARQEFLPGHAEDHFKVVSRGDPVTVPYGTFDHALRTHEWTPIEPGVLDGKVYVKGVGEVKEVTLHGPTERLVLVQIIRD